MEQPPGRTVVLEEDAGTRTVLGSAKMGPNRPGRGDHVGTASFMVEPEARGPRRRPGARRVRRAVAPRRRATAASSSTPWSRPTPRRSALWQSLGFEIIGTVPGRLPLTRARVRRAARDVPAPGLSPFRETGRGTSPRPWWNPLVNLGDVPRLVWVLAAGRFVSSASAFLMLFLTLYLTGPRELPVATAGLVAGGYGVGDAGRQLHRRPLGRPVRPPPRPAACSTASPAWAPPRSRGCRSRLLAVGAAGLGLPRRRRPRSRQGALAALAVPAGDRRTSVAISRAASNAGFVIGPPLGALLVAHSYDALFVVDGLMTLVAASRGRAVACRDEPRRSRAGPTPRPSLWRALRADRALLAAAAGGRAGRPRLPPALHHAAAAPARRTGQPLGALHRARSRSAPG